MKVCFIIGTLGRGGAEKQLLFMLRAIKNAKIDCRTLCLTKGEEYEAEIKAMGIPVEWIGASEKRFFRLAKIISNLRKNPADVVQSSHFYTNIYTGIAGKVLGIPSIGAVRNDLTSEIQMHGFLGKWQVSMPDLLVANSWLAYQRLLERGISVSKIKFVSNVVETKTQNSVKKTETSQSINILFVGRLHQNKRPERFIKLSADLIKRFPNLPLYFQIAGDGALRAELENLATELGLMPDRLKFLGICQDMDAVYRQADILISTSECEGTPNVVLEAMSHGLPVIATNVGGTPEILDDTRGSLVNAGDDAGLLNAAVQLIESPALRFQLGNEGQKYVEQNHSLGNLKIELLKIYEKLTHGNAW